MQIADQAASLFGSCCFEEGEVKLTMGTGTFLNVNTGHKPQASLAGCKVFYMFISVFLLWMLALKYWILLISGLYPQVGWKIGDEVVYVMEGAANDTGTVLKWAEKIGNNNFIAYETQRISSTF